MENRSQHLLLSTRTPRVISTALLTGLLCLSPMGPAQAQEGGSAPVQVIEPDIEPRSISEADIDAEFFEVGAFAGMLTIDNFSSEPLVGVSAAFHATEDFFLQFNYGMSEAGLTSFEELSGANVRLLTDEDRDYSYYDFLVGYNIFPGEIFFSDSLTFNSAFYLVGGVGNTEFGGESNFTTTVGTGFRIVLLDWLTVHVDFRDHMFDSDLIRESQLTHNIELSSGITLFF
ncbi:outer membrane beta-barrel protein [Marinobacter pelagius]|uniref:Outer membrane beta-barrel protein n=1 Tax=Marinobacter pelagius TaxID=379482 RepID=A0A366GXD6_9GAMM|nr:outer membrane beta-barrel domain-containing protein [Marinobacter pelagius]RBP33387.1 outer membrane beta-barrel protein [Marinobacter pelagius]